MVYSATLCGLNAVLWAPHFGLSVVQQNLRSLLPSYYQCDMDIGKMFLNFSLNPNTCPYTGVDITHVKGRSTGQGVCEQGKGSMCERLSGNFMGLTESPYRTL